MTHVHFEPFVHLAGLTHDDVLIAWGGFWFRDPDRDDDAWRIVEDPEMGDVDEGRHRGSIGVSSEPFGDARVEVMELATGQVIAEEHTSEANHVWVRGLQPDTGYRYRTFVDGEPWAEGPRRDWVTDRLDSRGRDLEVPHVSRPRTRRRHCGSRCSVTTAWGSSPVVAVANARAGWRPRLNARSTTPGSG